ncbi:16S rRNA (guanine(527)-N(7))-methyltransferase RsmG [Allocoleopsis franciscana]|uniref:Ribosomal RNA small subunit methyltransferase G n=1 Tax=Allocoleopsis franciscana PCC 7113 TaxID=1173027 RepID=K9W6J6_9CYAN|nr:16S rRNA (guanine(527)-N(7))-methyltransferase RsmG [Allocoleopsis franciscana]AFZ15995.1 16S rRNA m(7)G-527 methyltransferase [Allocoleopsis franciscana PCC 7113]
MGASETLLLPEMLDIWQLTLGWQPTDEQQGLFQQFYEGILEGNQRLNLTRITEPMDFWEKHLWDSLRGFWTQESGFVAATPTSLIQNLKGNSEIQPQSLKLIDIGTGAGFPGIPVAIAFPHHSVTLLDSTRKKITFLEALITQLGIQNVTTLVGRAESLTHQLQHRQTYDIALLRAVAPASVCAEYALPLLKTGGLAILYRGHWTDEETESLKSILEKLGGGIEFIEEFTTPISKSVRHCIYLRSSAPLKELPLKK